MVDFASLFGIIKSLSDLVQGLIDLKDTVSEASLKRQRAAIRQALRALYFSPDGVLGVLEDLSKGKKVQKDRYSRVVTGFNDSAREVQRTLCRIDFEELAHDLRINLSTAKNLYRIGQDKITVRQDVEDLLNRSVLLARSLTESRRSELKRICSKIKLLNKKIEKLDDMLGQ
jgi:hypothetical protein